MENPEQQPGQVIGPQPASPPPAEPRPTAASEPERQPDQPTAPEASYAAPAAQAPQSPSVQQVEQASQPAPAADTAGWNFHAEASEPAAATLPADDISWTALEFIPHDKSAGWYGVLALVGLAGAALMYLISRDIISTAVVIIAAVMMGIFAARKPREQAYALSVHGLRVGARQYSLQNFKSFSLSDEGSVGGITFMPLKRFMPPLTIHVAPEAEDRVVNFLSARLPVEQHRQDAVDSLLRRIHF